MSIWRPVSQPGKRVDAAEFAANLWQACVTPHIAPESIYSAIDDRTTLHNGDAKSQRTRKRIDVRRDSDPLDRCLILIACDWATTVGGMTQTGYRGLERVRSRFVLTMAANNLARLPRLRAA